jgi:hypothetical protein
MSDIDVGGEENQDQTNLMNKAVGYVISKYIYEIKKYKWVKQNQQYQQRKMIFMN